MKALIPLLFLCSVASAQPTFKLRIYDVHANAMVANLRASQLHKADTTYAKMEVYLLSTTTVAALRDAAAAVRSLGIRVVPGMRLVDRSTFETKDWVSSKLWDEKALELAAIADLRVDGDLRVYVDAENYVTSYEATSIGLAKIGATREQLKAAMAPFLKVIADKNIVPCFTPGNSDDQVQTLSAEVCPTLEFLCESTFGNDWEIRGSMDSTLPHLVAWHKERREIYRLFPRAKATPGFYDETMRDFGCRARDSYNIAHGEPDCWLFDRRRQDQMKIGTAEWLTGMSLSTLNDCLWFSLREPAGLDEWQNRHKLTEWWRGVSASHAGKKPETTMRNWYWPVGERYLKDDACKLCRTTWPFTIAADVFVAERKAAPLFGIWFLRQDGFSSWQVRYADGRWLFDWQDDKNKVYRSAASVAAKDGAQRLVVNFDGSKAMLSCDGEAAEVACKPEDSPQISFTIGPADGLFVRDMMAWSRSLTDRELAMVRTAAVYPFEK